MGCLGKVCSFVHIDGVAANLLAGGSAAAHLELIDVVFSVAVVHQGIASLVHRVVAIDEVTHGRILVLVPIEGPFRSHVGRRVEVYACALGANHSECAAETMVSHVEEDKV